MKIINKQISNSQSKERIRANKVKLRKALKEQRRNIPLEKKRLADTEIVSRLLMTREYSSANLVLCYMNTNDEINTSPLIYAALANGKSVGLPRCNGERLDFYYIKSLDDLVVGSYGIMEPSVKRCKRITDYSNSILVAPGLSFSPDGNRIGYGRGYYDRFLAAYSGRVIGLCYNSLVKLNIPVEETDKKVNVLITEKYTRNI